MSVANSMANSAKSAGPLSSSVSNASATNVSALQIRLTMPQSIACRAPNGSPVSKISLARRVPTARGKFCVPPAPGMMPRVTSVSANRTCSAA